MRVASYRVGQTNDLSSTPPDFSGTARNQQDAVGVRELLYFPSARAAGKSLNRPASDDLLQFSLQHRTRCVVRLRRMVEARITILRKSPERALARLRLFALQREGFTDRAREAARVCPAEITASRSAYSHRNRKARAGSRN